MYLSDLTLEDLIRNRPDLVEAFREGWEKPQAKPDLSTLTLKELRENRPDLVEAALVGWEKPKTAAKLLAEGKVNVADDLAGRPKTAAQLMAEGQRPAAGTVNVTQDVAGGAAGKQ